MALAAEYFVAALCNALKGQKSVQCAYVKSNIVKDVDYFAGPIELGPNGVVTEFIISIYKTFKGENPSTGRTQQLWEAIDWKGDPRLEERNSQGSWLYQERLRMKRQYGDD